jgi:hypothetical protein
MGRTEAGKLHDSKRQYHKGLTNTLITVVSLRCARKGKRNEPIQILHDTRSVFVWIRYTADAGNDDT